jgi:hypothetical protein
VRGQPDGTATSGLDVDVVVVWAEIRKVDRNRKREAVSLQPERKPVAIGLDTSRQTDFPFFGRQRSRKVAGVGEQRTGRSIPKRCGDQVVGRGTEPVRISEITKLIE